jgi:hypothetical protein
MGASHGAKSLREATERRSFAPWEPERRERRGEQAKAPSPYGPKTTCPFEQESVTRSAEAEAG